MGARGFLRYWLSSVAMVAFLLAIVGVVWLTADAVQWATGSRTLAMVVILLLASLLGPGTMYLISNTRAGDRFTAWMTTHVFQADRRGKT
jgi:hypothetical protein